MYHAIIWITLILTFALLVYVEKRHDATGQSWWGIAFFTASIAFTLAAVLACISFIIGVVWVIGMLITV